MKRQHKFWLEDKLVELLKAEAARQGKAAATLLTEILTTRLAGESNGMGKGRNQVAV
jgi:plasmid stability protein